MIWKKEPIAMHIQDQKFYQQPQHNELDISRSFCFQTFAIDAPKPAWSGMAGFGVFFVGLKMFSGEYHVKFDFV